MSRLWAEFGENQQPDSVVIDPSRRISTGTTTYVDRGVIPGPTETPVAVKSVRPGVNDWGMLAREVRAYRTLSGIRGMAENMSPFLVSGDESRLVMLDLPEFGYTEDVKDFITGLTLPEQRRLFLQLGRAAFSFLSTAQCEGGMLIRDIFGSGPKGLWVGKDDREGEVKFKFVFTDFGLWDEYKDGDGSKSMLRRMFLVEDDGRASMFGLFPFIQILEGRIEVTDPVLSGYVDKRTGLSLGEILTSVVKGDLDQIPCDKKYGATFSYLALWVFFEEMLNGIPMDTLRLVETAHFSVDALARRLLSAGLTPTQWMILAAPFGITAEQLKAKLIEL